MAIFILWICHFMVDVQIGIFAVYKTMAGLDLATAGLIGMIAAMLGEGCQVFFGSMSDNGHRKKLILLGMLLTASSSLMGYTTDTYVLLVLILLTFIGSAAFHPAAAGLIPSLSKRQGLFFALFACGGAFGLALSQVAFYQVYHYLNGQTAILALPLLLLSIVVLLYPLKSVKPKVKTQFSAVLKLFKRTDLRCLYVVQVCNQTLYWATIFLLPDVLGAMDCPEWITFGGGHLAFILGGATMMVPGGILSDLYSPRKVMICAMSAGLVFFYLFLGCGSIHPFAILGLLACLGASFSCISPLGLTMGQQLLPGQPGLVSAFIMGMVWCISESLAPASGILTKLFSDGNIPAKALLCMSVLNLAGVWAAFRLPIQPQEESVPAVA